MACDRFVYWNECRPTKQEIQFVLEDFFGAAGVVTWGWTTPGCPVDGTGAPSCSDRFFVTLVGNKSESFRRIPEAAAFVDPDIRERWIEVYIGKDNIDVITRLQDEYTSTLASGVAKLFARCWEGRLEEG